MCEQPNQQGFETPLKKFNVKIRFKKIILNNQKQ